MDSNHIKILINNKQKEIEDLERLLKKLQIAEASQRHSIKEPSIKSSAEAESRGLQEVNPLFTPGSIVYYCQETRGKRRYFTNKGTILKRDKRFLHIKTVGGEIIRRTPRYTRKEPIVEE